jgi:hypothetical protein
MLSNDITDTETNNIQENKYLISMRKANKKYRETHKEKFCDYQKKYYQEHKHDEEYMKKQRLKALKSYYKKRALMTTTSIVENEHIII